MAHHICNVERPSPSQHRAIHRPFLGICCSSACEDRIRHVRAFVPHFDRQSDASEVKEWFSIRAANGSLARVFFFMFDGYVLETDKEGVSYALTLYHGRFRSESMSPMRRIQILRLQGQDPDFLTTDEVLMTFPQMA